MAKTKVIEYFNFKEEDGTFFLTDYDELTKLKTASGDYYVESNTEEFILFIIDDFERCGELTLNKDHSINFNSVPCAYAIYSDQRSFFTSSNKQNVHEHIRKLPAYDGLLIQTANGPEEVTQLERQSPGHDALLELISIDECQMLSGWAMANHYVHNGYAEQDDYEGPGEYISDENFLQTPTAENIFQIFDRLTLTEKGALFGLFNLTGQKSYLVALLLIMRKISIPSFVKISTAIGNNILAIILEDEDEPDMRSDQYAHLEKMANLCLTYAGLQTDPLNEDISKGESNTTEFKSTFFMDITTHGQSEIIIVHVMKTIAAFLNSSGGTLYVGVNDDGHKIGVQGEIDSLFGGNKDKYLLRIKDKLKKYIPSFNGNVDWSLEKRDGFEILIFKVAKSAEPFFYVEKNKEIFYVRTNPATEVLEGSLLLKYIKEHF